MAKSTQNQAFNAILFFFRHVLEKEVGSIQSVVRAKRGHRLPTVLTKAEVMRLIGNLGGTCSLLVRAIYGGGLRLNECTRLRVKDLDFERSTITVRAGKGDKDRQTLLPENVARELKIHLEQIRTIRMLLGHSDLQTTMIYTHVAKKKGLGVRSPLMPLRSEI